MSMMVAEPIIQKRDESVTSLHLGGVPARMGEELAEIRSSSPAEPIERLRDRLQADGYLCLRGLIPVEAVVCARRVVYRQMEADGVLSPHSTFDWPRGRGAVYMGQKHVTHHPDFIGLVEHPVLFDFFKALFGEPARTFDYKWARAVPLHGTGTGIHIDKVYMGRGSPRVHTTWIPIGDVSRDNGPMVLLDNSHNHPALQRIRETYGEMDVDRDGIEGYFSKSYREMQNLTGTRWLVGDYRMGDVIIMGMYLFHGALRNEIDRLRFTVDVRFQPASDSADNRWIGEAPIAHSAPQTDHDTIPIETARARWGV